MNGPTTFLTWNWGAAVSTDGGGTWSFLNPFAQFPAAYGLFCCDQVVRYDPTNDLYIWVLQYSPDASGNNALRVAVAHGASGLTSGAFSYWDIKPQDPGVLAPNGTSYDQPKIALTQKYLYLEATQYPGAKSYVLRVPLTELATNTSAGGPLSYEAYSTGAFFSPGLAQGATTTMYFAAHDLGSKLRVWSWPDGAPSPTPFYVMHTSYPHSIPYQCPHTGATNLVNSDWCRRPSGASYAHDDRINSGWIARGTVGFTWDASQGTVGTTTYPYPYVDIVEFTQDTSGTRLAEPIIWSTGYAYSYAAIAPNARGDLGGTVMYGGGSSYENCAAVMHDDFTTGNWDIPSTLTASGRDTSNSKSGDYLASRGNGGNSNTWGATCYALHTSDSASDPQYFSFGRLRDSPIKTLTVTRTGSGTGTVASAPAGIDCGATCSATFWQDMQITLTPTPTGTDAFTGWSGACSGTGPCVVAMSDSKSVTATFKKTFRLTVSKTGTGRGRVSSQPGSISCGSTCSALIPEGTSVTLTAAAARGSVFLGWTGGLCSGRGTCTVPVDAARTVGAQFALRLTGAIGRGLRLSLTSPSGRFALIPGGTYVVVVFDRSRLDNFHLSGRGVARKTGVRFRGKVTWIVTFASGRTYRYGSDRHRGVRRLHRKFRAT